MDTKIKIFSTFALLFLALPFLSYVIKGSTLDCLSNVAVVFASAFALVALICVAIEAWKNVKVCLINAQIDVINKEITVLRNNLEAMKQVDETKCQHAELLEMNEQLRECVKVCMGALTEKQKAFEELSQKVEELRSCNK